MPEAGVGRREQGGCGRRQKEARRSRRQSGNQVSGVLVEWRGSPGPAASRERSRRTQVGYQYNETIISGVESGKFAVEHRVLALFRLSKTNGLALFASQ